jgi:hypothetical protein
VGHPSRNTQKLSEHILTKRVQIGSGDLPHAIEYDVVFTLPKGETHRYAQFEGVTGYMPPEFSRFWTFRATTGELQPLDDGPGEQPHPVVLATPDGGHAMGVYSPDQPSPGYETAGYGRFRFKAEKVNKWNCVFRLNSKEVIEAGDYRFKQYVVVGSLDEVKTTLAALARRHAKK